MSQQAGGEGDEGVGAGGAGFLSQRREHGVGGAAWVALTGTRFS